MAVTLRPLYFIPFLMTNKLLLILVIRVLNQLGSVLLRLKQLRILNLLLNPSKKPLRSFKKNLILILKIWSLSPHKLTQLLVKSTMDNKDLKAENIQSKNYLETWFRI